MPAVAPASRSSTEPSSPGSPATGRPSSGPNPLERLRARRDFEAVMRDGRPRRHRLLVLRSRPNGLDHSRLGFAVSRRVGNAVTRNRVRRRLRAALRALPIEPGHDIVVGASPAAVDATFGELSRACVRTAEQSGLLRADIR